MPNEEVHCGSEQAISFLVEDYKLKTDYLTNHFSRMWIRFNFFLSIETALLGVVFLADKDAWSRHATTFAGFGVLVSTCWYIFGAQDRYLVELYRDQVKLAGNRVTETFKNAFTSDTYQKIFSNFRYAGDTADKPEKIKPGIFQWRWDPISITRLAAVFPAAVLLAWVFALRLMATDK